MYSCKIADVGSWNSQSPVLERILCCREVVLIVRGKDGPKHELGE